MRRRTKEEEKAYKRTLRARQKVVLPDVLPDVPPVLIVPPLPGNVPPLVVKPSPGSPVSSAPDLAAQDVLPGDLPPANPQPVPLAAAPCQNCIKLSAEVARLRADLAAMQDQQPGITEATRTTRRAHRSTDRVNSAQAPPGSFFKTTPPKAAPADTEAEALHKRVIDEKVNRINNYGRYPVIGRV